MADWHRLAVTFDPPANPAVLAAICAAMEETDYDWPTRYLGPSGVIPGDFAERIGGVLTCPYRSPQIDIEQIAAAFTAAGLTGHGFMQQERHGIREIYPSSCFIFGALTPEQERASWAEIVAQVERGDQIEGLLEFRIRRALPRMLAALGVIRG